MTTIGLWEARAADVLVTLIERPPGSRISVQCSSAKEAKVIYDVLIVAAASIRVTKMPNFTLQAERVASRVGVDDFVLALPSGERMLMTDVAYFGMQDAAYKRLAGVAPGTECWIAQPQCKALEKDWGDFIKALDEDGIWSNGMRGMGKI